MSGKPAAYLDGLAATRKRRTLVTEVVIGIAAAVIGVAIRSLIPIRPEQLPTTAVVIMLALVATFVGTRAGVVTALLGGLTS